VFKKRSSKKAAAVGLDLDASDMEGVIGGRDGGVDAGSDQAEHIFNRGACRALKTYAPRRSQRQLARASAGDLRYGSPADTQSAWLGLRGDGQAAEYLEETWPPQLKSESPLP
jgi:hypothetical protein